MLVDKVDTLITAAARLVEVTERIEEWSLVGDNGSPDEIFADMLGRLKYAVLDLERGEYLYNRIKDISDGAFAVKAGEEAE